MKRYILRLLLALAVIFGGTKAVNAETLEIVTEVTGASVVCYSEESAPTASYTNDAPSAPTTVNGKYLVIKVTPNDGKWIFDKLLTIEAAGKPGGALAPHRALGITANPIAINTTADGSGYYYYQIPANWDYGNNCYRVIVRATAIDKIDLSTATIDATTGKVVTATAGAWTATITLNQVSWTYDGTAHGPEISSFSLSNGTDTFDNTAKQVSISGTGTDKGDYNATLTAVAGGCFTNSKTVPFTITKKKIIEPSDPSTPGSDPTLEITLTPTSTPYNGADQKPTITVKDGATTLTVDVDYTVKYQLNGSDVIETKDAHQYDVIIASKADGNYDFSVTKKFEITGVAPVVTAPEAKTLTYTGSAQELITAGTTTGGTLQYALSSGGTYSAELPKGTAAGNYTVYYKVVGDGNYTDVAEAGPVNVTIGKRKIIQPTDPNTPGSDPTLMITLAPETVTYNNADQKPTITVKDDTKDLALNTDYTVTYQLNGADVTETKDAHQYDVIIASKADGNYDFNVKKSFTITKAALTNVTLVVSTLTFNGSELSPTINIVKAGTLDVSADAYTVSGDKQTAVGDYTLRVTAKDDSNFSGYAEAHWSIIAEDASTFTVSGIADSYEYTGSDITPEPTVKEGTTTLTKDVDYTVEYSANRNVGTATVTVKGKGGYSGTKVAHFTITPKAITITASDQTVTYGTPIAKTTDQVTVSPALPSSDALSAVTLTPSTENVTTDGTATITPSDAVIKNGDINVNANYTINYTAGKLIINKKKIVEPGTPGSTDPTTLNITLTPATTVYNNADQKPTITVKDDTKDLVLNTDYTVTYQLNGSVVTETKDAHQYDVIIASTADGNYDFNVKKSFTITKAALTNVTLVESTLTFNGSELSPTINTVKAGTLDVPADVYTVSGDKQTAVGDYTLRVTAKDDSNFSGYAEAHWSIIAEDASTFTVSGIADSYEYTGSDITPEPTVKEGTTPLTKDVDYTVEYSANRNVGTATVTVKGKGGYSGTKVAHFTITPKEAMLSWSNLSFDYDGNSHVPTCIVSNLIGTDECTVTVTGAQTEVGDYTATATALSNNNYKLPADCTKGFSIHGAGTIDRKHSNIVVKRNDTGAEVDNEAYLTKMSDGTLRIDQVKIVAPADATTANPVAVTVYIPTTLKDYDGTTGNTYGVATDIIVTDANVPVTDVWMPETDAIVSVAPHAFRLNATESVTARIHTTLPLLDDYALCSGLAKEYADGHVMTTIKTTTQYWTLSSAVDIVVPEGQTAYICKADGTTAVTAIAITLTTATIDGTERVIVKANNGVMLGGTPGTYDLIAWPSADRPSGSAPSTADAKSYDGNQLVPALVKTHFTPTEYYILYNNTFHELKADDDTSVSPCKAVLRKTSSAMAPSLSINNSETGISTLNADCETSNDDSWFDLNGRKLSTQPTTKGLYIHNGRKTIIR